MGRFILRTVTKIFFGMLLISCFSMQLILLSGCGFHLRNQNSLPASLQPLEVISAKPYEPFIKQLNRELALLKTQRYSHQPRTQLIIHKHKLNYRMPIIGSSQQARIYRYTFYVEYSLKSNDKFLINKKSIMINRLLTLNEDVLLTTNNQLDLLTVDIQQAAILQLINELKAFSTVSRYNQHEEDREEDLPPDMDSESPLMPYEEGSNG